MHNLDIDVYDIDHQKLCHGDHITNYTEINGIINITETYMDIFQVIYHIEIKDLQSEYLSNMKPEIQLSEYFHETMVKLRSPISPTKVLVNARLSTRSAGANELRAPFLLGSVAP